MRGLTTTGENLQGAAHGLAALPQDWAVQVEGRATILLTGEALFVRSASALESRPGTE